VWNCVGVSVRGTSHEQTGKPCQDYCGWQSGELAGERVLLIAIADGAGSAARSQEGSQIVVETLLFHASRYTGTLANLCRDDAIGWLKIAQERVQAVAADSSSTPGAFAATALLAIMGENSAVFVQIGDGAWVAENAAGLTAATWPQTGEYANVTIFVTSADALDKAQFVVVDGQLRAVAGFTDGVQTLCLDLAARQPHGPFFTRILAPLRDCDDPMELNAPLIGLLNSPLFNDRTDDDKTLVLACRRDVTESPGGTAVDAANR
jgi:hypothetical protein